MRRRRLAAAALLLALGAVEARAAGFRLVFTASLGGGLEGCDCRVGPQAGLLKTAAWLRSERDPEHDLLLDAGDLFDGSPDEPLERAILDTYVELGYACIAVGDQELAAGPERLLDYRASYPFACHNLSIKTGRGEWVPFSPRPFHVRVGGASVVVVSLLAPESVAELPRPIADRIRVEPPDEVARRLLGEPALKDADYVILLFHGPLDRARDLVSGVPGFDVAIVAHEQRLVPADREGNTVIASPGEAANRIGLLAVTRRPLAGLSFSGDFRSFSARFGPDDPSVGRRLEAYKAELRARLKDAAP